VPPVKPDDTPPDVPLSAVTRREFLAMGGAASLALFPGCMPEFHPGGEHPDGVRPPGGPESVGRAACALCVSGCGVTVRVVGDRAVGLSGNPEHPVNRGALCPRGAAGLQHLYDLDRVVGPARRIHGKLQRITWDEALDELARRVAGGSVVLVDGLRGVEADLAGRFARAAEAVHVRADTLREAHERVVGRLAWDWSETRMVMLFGCEWLEDAPDLMASLRAHAHLKQGRPGTRAKIVHVGPRFSASAGHADEFVPVHPGSEAALALGMAHVMLGERSTRTSTPPEAYRALAARYTPEETARLTGVAAETVARLAHEFAALSPQVAIGWRGPLDHANGSDALRAVHALNALGGSLGAAGGLREVAAPPLQDWEAAPASPISGSGASRVLIAAGCNPVFAAPELLKPFAGATFRVAIGSLLDETAQAADLVLPTPTWLERFEVDVPPATIPTVTVSRPAIAPLHDTKTAGDILIATAQRVPALAPLFRWESYEEAARERLFGLFLSGRGSIRDEKWETFQQRVEEAGGWWDADASRPPTPAPDWPSDWKPPAHEGNEGPVLVTFAPIALGDGDGARLPFLQERAGWQHDIGWDSWIEVNPSLGFRTGERVVVRSPHGEVRTRVVATPACPPDVVAMPLGQGHTASGRWASGRGVDARRLGSGVRVTLRRA
jgi:anaerobic selenocysteine-containing dehydrogenase